MVYYYYYIINCINRKCIILYFNDYKVYSQVKGSLLTTLTDAMLGTGYGGREHGWGLAGAACES